MTGGQGSKLALSRQNGNVQQFTASGNSRRAVPDKRSRHLRPSIADLNVTYGGVIEVFPVSSYYIAQRGRRETAIGALLSADHKSFNQKGFCFSGEFYVYSRGEAIGTAYLAVLEVIK